MNLLLDTHALFWSIYDPESLSGEAATNVSDKNNVTWATLASAQEIALKLSVGRWLAALDLLIHFETRLAEANYSLIAPTAIDYANLLRLPDIDGHRDPYDRLIIAQALARGMTLVTSDANVPSYGVSCIYAGRGPRPNEARGLRLMPAQPLISIALPTAPPEEGEK